MSIYFWPSERAYLPLLSLKVFVHFGTSAILFHYQIEREIFNLKTQKTLEDKTNFQTKSLSLSGSFKKKI